MISYLDGWLSWLSVVMVTLPYGMLYELITDMGYLNEQGHIWQGLSDVHGNGDFFDAQFRLQTSERRKTELE